MTTFQQNTSSRPPVALDTSVASLFLVPRAGTTEYARLIRGYDLILPAVTYAELEQGARIDGWGPSKRRRFEHFLKRVTLLPVTKTTADHWASLRFECRRRGIGNTDNDAWIAAVALEVGCPLVSNDRIHLRMQTAAPQLQVLSLLST